LIKNTLISLMYFHLRAQYQGDKVRLLAEKFLEDWVLTDGFAVFRVPQSPPLSPK